MTSDDFRRLALSMHGASEGAHMGHPDFRVSGRIFATLQADDEWGGLKLTPAEQQALRRGRTKVFVPAARAWGRQGWTRVRLDGAEEAEVRGALLLAWQNAQEKTGRGRKGR
jgi:hypothetical protein